MVKLKQHHAPVPSETVWKLGPIDHIHETRPMVTVKAGQFITSGTKPAARTGYDIILVKDLPELDTRLWLEVKVDVEGLESEC